MKSFYFIFILWAGFALTFKVCQAKEVTLCSKDFQKEFLQQISQSMKSTAKEYLNSFLKKITRPAIVAENFDLELQMALSSKRLEPKIVFIKQYLDMAEHKDTSRENMYSLRNVNFLKKLKNKLHQLQEDSFEEMHQLRYFYLCKQFKIKKIRPAHNFYSVNTLLAPTIDYDVLLSNLNRTVRPTVSVNVTEFGIELYKKVNDAGCDVINDYLIILRKLLQEVLEPQSEEEATPHSEALRKILIEIDQLLKISDFYAKRQRLYDYLQNHLALDYEQIQSSESSQHDLMEIFNKVKEKGLDLVMAFLFSNFEFIDYLQDQWKILLPQARIAQYDKHSRPLKQIQELYQEFKDDFENSTKYEAYLESVKSLHEQTQQDNTDTSHIFEMLHSASQNVGSSRATLMNAKCREI